jgi:hypothetical protein
VLVKQFSFLLKLTKQIFCIFLGQRKRIGVEESMVTKQTDEEANPSKIRILNLTTLDILNGLVHL